MFGLGTGELLVILVIVVMLFGAKRIPEIMQGLGKGIRTFKKAMDEDQPASVPPAPPQVEPGTKAKEEKAEPK
jgi:sec-independent protein translocase protein TatA